ncbi:MAG TPA: OmpA family protein [Xanthobacteraceae bacterium]
MMQQLATRRPRGWRISRAGFFAAALACTVGLVALVPLPRHARADDTCGAIAQRIATARQARDLAALTKALAGVSGPESSCSEKARYCLGRSVALGYLAEVYARSPQKEAAGAKASPDELEALLATARSYGAPWQLLVALADRKLERAKAAHDPALYGAAAYDYQLALLDLRDDPACADYGEPPPPVAPQIAEIHQRMSTALLLAAPIKIATGKCSICQWAFLSAIRNFTPSVRPLPITFNSNRSEPTAEGREAIAALVECLNAQKPPQIVLSGHTDEVGSASFNMKLSAERLATVQRLLQQGGFAGKILLEPKGKSEPYKAGDLSEYSEAERQRLNRRIELRAFAEGEAPTCGP